MYELQMLFFIGLGMKYRVATTLCPLSHPPALNTVFNKRFKLSVLSTYSISTWVPPTDQGIETY